MMDTAESSSAAPTTARKPRRGRSRLALALIVLGLVGLAVAVNRRVSPNEILAHYDALRHLVEAHFALAWVSFVAVYATAVSLCIPGAMVLTAMSGLLFGWFWGGAAAVLSATLGGLVLFMVARTAFGALLAGRVASLAAWLRAAMADNAVFYLLFVRLTPVFPFWLVNLGCAMVGVPLPLFAATTFFGIMPASFAFALAGSGLAEAVALHQAAQEACLAAARGGCAQEFSFRSLARPELLGGLAALGALALVPVLARRLGWMRPGRPAAGPADE